MHTVLPFIGDALQSHFFADKRHWIKSMSYRIDESVISNFLTNHTRALRLSAFPLDPLSRQCPICRDLYHAQDPAYLHPLLPADTHEYPVQVRDRGPCNHILGRRCIERHVRAGQPWSHACPLCREEWFPAPNSARTEIVSTLDNVLGALERLEMRDEVARQEVENMEQALETIREMLYSQRWI
ncbi:hypothetical protein PMIN06_000845 [Paraphaeosphaeria minitans]